MPRETAFRALTKFSDDPVKWIEMGLRAKLWSKQRQIAESVRDHPRTAVVSCHASGKTFLAAHIAIWFLYSHRDSQVITTAPVFRQVRENLWGEMHRAFDNAPLPLGYEQVSWMQCRLSLAGQWKAIGFSTDKMERFAGFHGQNILIIVDEASGVKEDTFGALEGILSSGAKIRLLLISQGTQTAGSFFDAFHTQRSLYNTLNISAWDTPNFQPEVLEAWQQAGSPHEYKWPQPHLINPAWVEGRKIAWGEGTPLWDVKVLGQFPPADPYAIIPLNWAEAAATRDGDEEGPGQIGVDIARTGLDLTVVVARKGNKLIKMTTRAVTTGPEVEGMVLEMSKETGITKIVGDADGVGGPVLDYMRKNHKEWEVADFHSAAKAKDVDTYENMKAESWHLMAERFRTGDISFADLPKDQRDDLVADLVSIRKEFTARGRVKMESKDDLRERIGRSPDRADAFMLSFVTVGSFGQWLAYIKQQTPDTEKPTNSDQGIDTTNPFVV